MQDAWQSRCKSRAPEWTSLAPRPVTPALTLDQCPAFHHQFKHLPRRVHTTMSFFGAATSTTAAVPDKDVEVADPPPDSISSLSFSPQADYLAVGSWDNNVGGVTALAVGGK